MKIAVIGANGKQGSLLIKEAKNRGVATKGIVRSGNSAADETLVKDALALTYEDVKDCEVIIDALGFWTPETLEMHSTTLKHFTNILAGKENRLLVVGGAGSLYVNPEHTVQVFEGEDFPAVYRPLAEAQAKQLEELRKVDNVNWTYVSPAGDFQADGVRTGEYILSGEELTLNSKGESVISYADYAIAMIDEATKGNHIKQRISVVVK